MQKKRELIRKIRPVFEQTYPGACCSLHFKQPHELLIATQLAAQCTDARVNLVTPELFLRYPSVGDFAEAEQSELERYIRSTGFFRNKAKNIIECCRMLRDQFGGIIPDTMDRLLLLPGVGRKTANLLLGDLYGIPSVVVDTHCIRLSGRMGLTEESNPAKIEAELRMIVPEDYQTKFCHTLVFHGRAFCKAQKPDCEHCPIREFCPKMIKNKRESAKKGNQ